jgi:hypothetical protein
MTAKSANPAKLSTVMAVTIRGVSSRPRQLAKLADPRLRGDEIRDGDDDGEREGDLATDAEG